jgi:hypothetical protein
MPTTKYKSHNAEPYAIAPVQFKVLPGVLEQLRQVPEWREKLRAYVDELIAENGQTDRDA